MTLDIRKRAIANWFWLAAPWLVAIEWAVQRSVPPAAAGPSEAVALFDLCVFVPGLYALCYARVLPARALALRLVGLVCLGILLASWLVPAPQQVLLPQLGWLRTMGMVVLAALELAVLAAVVRVAFSGKVDAAALAAQSGAPEWIARLMLLEVRFWRWLWRTLRGR